MTWVYDQSSGWLSRDGALTSRGYSGNGRGKNAPSLQAAEGIGPIPRGWWTMVRVYDSKNVGPFAIELQPDAGTETFGRSAFRIHGDRIRDPGNASHGCLIFPRAIREQVWKSGDRKVHVIG